MPNEFIAYRVARSPFIVVALAACAFAGSAQARDVYWSVGISSPGVQVGVANAPPPVVYHQRPVVVVQAPLYAPAQTVYVQPPQPAYYYSQPHLYGQAPFYTASPPYGQPQIYYSQPPVIVAPRPVIVQPGWGPPHPRHRGRDDFRRNWDDRGLRNNR